MESVVALSEARLERAKRGQDEENRSRHAVPPDRCRKITPFPKSEVTDIHGASRFAGHVSPACKLGDAALTIALIPAFMSLHWIVLGCAALLHVTNYGGSTCTNHRASRGEKYLAFRGEK